LFVFYTSALTIYELLRIDPGDGSVGVVASPAPLTGCSHSPGIDMQPAITNSTCSKKKCFTTGTSISKSREPSTSNLAQMSDKPHTMVSLETISREFPTIISETPQVRTGEKAVLTNSLALDIAQMREQNPQAFRQSIRI
jgi:hypothetical protein